MDRRDFLKTSLVAGSALATGIHRVEGASAVIRHEGQIVTVRGPIDPEKMGFTLPHEHVLVDFVGADKVSPDRYDQDMAFDYIRPHLREAKTLGVDTMVECTPSYLGKDPVLCRRLSEATGLHLLTNVGYYGAANDKFVPAFAYEEATDALADRWVKDADSVDDTGIQPGFIKIGVDKETLSEIDAKLVRAAARTHLRTGLLIYSHTGYATPAMEEIAILKEEGVDPSAWVWTHAQNEKDNDQHEKAAREGAWIAFDGVGPGEKKLKRDLAHFGEMKKRGLLGSVHLSHDAGWYRPQTEQKFRSYDFIFKMFLGKLKEIGLTDEDIHQVTVENPKRALTVAVRSL
jgi:predicted metal-dependent phosphotriesterase family hydrolase